ncbi:hypothetical protein BLNAU_20924 [Blattamonas nauphoetae]|uniref:GAF domain-containing protein n=1 Tax=Blattamonas nauphoetae TaxID=2049346 RepID=A0ABQ9WXD8_9EUKA|nr:hypothetical protein BLNAU_20924 [Blattamonas nauphoetae]
MKLLSSLNRPISSSNIGFVFFPIEVTFSNCLSIVEDSACLCITLNNINDSLTEWKAEGPEVAQSGKQMMQALFSEGSKTHSNRYRFWRSSQCRRDLCKSIELACSGSPSGFVEVAATLSFLQNHSSQILLLRCRLVESDLISNVLAAVQPHTLTRSGNEEMIDNLNKVIDHSVNLAFPNCLAELGITSAVDQFNHREMIFQKVVLPSCLSFVEDDLCPLGILVHINHSLPEWKEEGPEVVQSAKRMMQALSSESFEDTLEQTLMHNKDVMDSNLLMSVTPSHNC